MLKQSIKTEKGFTLAELLIVVAIVAVLAAIAIPLFSIQMEKGREATDIANVRGAYAEVMNAAILEDETPSSCTFDNGVYSKTVSLTQKENGWQTKLPITIAGIHSESSENGTDADYHWVGKPASGGSCKVEFNTATKEVFFYWNGSGSGTGGTTDNPGGNNDNPSSGGGSVVHGKEYAVSDITLEKGDNKFTITSPSPADIEIVVYTSKNAGSGNVVAKQVYKLSKGSNDLTINLPQGNNGSFTISLESGDLTEEQMNEMLKSISKIN